MKRKVTCSIAALIICALIAGCAESELPKIPLTSFDSGSETVSVGNGESKDDRKSTDTGESDESGELAKSDEPTEIDSDASDAGSDTSS